MRETQLRFATRLNSFGSRPDAYWPKGHGKPNPLELAERASKAEGLTDVDLNYPDHVGLDPRMTGEQIRDLGLAVNGLAMRYYSNPAFKIGAFTNRPCCMDGAWGTAFAVWLCDYARRMDCA